jgi:hypothetical protein
MKTPIVGSLGLPLWLGVARSTVWTLLIASMIGASANLYAQTSKEDLVGHWRMTKILIDGSPQDTHMVLHNDGTVEIWKVTAESRGEKLTGHWDVDGKMLVLDGDSSPFTFYEGQLVFPNVQGSRQFWEKIE